MQISYISATLDSAFPMRCQPHWEQGDRPISYLHVHNYLELGYCHQGSGIFMVGDRVMPFQSGDVSFIAPGAVHLAQSTPGSRSCWSWVNLDPIQMSARATELSWLDPGRLSCREFPYILSAEKFPDVTSAVRRIVDEMLDELPGRETILRAMVNELMVRMFRLTTGASRSDSLAPENYDRLAPALHHVAWNHAQPVDISNLARLCGLSAPHFRRLFRDTIGRSPRRYWHDVRLQMACSLLRNTSKAVLEVSREVGFETLSSFNRLFQRTYGTSPLRWRRGK